MNEGTTLCHEDCVCIISSARLYHASSVCMYVSSWWCLGRPKKDTVCIYLSIYLGEKFSNKWPVVSSTSLSFSAIEFNNTQQHNVVVDPGADIDRADVLLLFGRAQPSGHPTVCARGSANELVDALSSRERVLHGRSGHEDVFRGGRAFRQRGKPDDRSAHRLH